MGLKVLYERCAGCDVHKRTVTVHVVVPEGSETRTLRLPLGSSTSSLGRCGVRARCQSSSSCRRPVMSRDIERTAQSRIRLSWSISAGVSVYSRLALIPFELAL